MLLAKNNPPDCFLNAQTFTGSSPYKTNKNIEVAKATSIFLELVTGLEPATCSLRMSCTTNCATQANINLKINVITNELHFPQKYSRTAQDFALLLISSPHFARAIRPPDGTRNFAQLCYTSKIKLQVILYDIRKTFSSIFNAF